MISLELFTNEELNFHKKLENLTDADILNVTSNHISEAILRSSLANNQDYDNQILDYEAKIIDGKVVLSLTRKKESTMKRILREEKGAQTGNDVKIDNTEYNRTKDMSMLLNTVLKLKNLKAPLEKLPESALTIKKMKREVNEKILAK